ncbi:DUF6725 family protein [Isoptericola cucumis]|uniref:DUF6725 family protein n=1 Tax=Isoptericola cucumis TaxID=1776856 RepID=UPI00320904A9
MVLPPSAPRPSAWRDLPVGARVVVRRRLAPEEADGHVWTDVIGVVLDTGPHGLRLRRDPARGSGVPGEADEVVVPAEAIEAAKRIPPRPAPRRPRRR